MVNKKFVLKFIRSLAVALGISSLYLPFIIYQWESSPRAILGFEAFLLSPIVAIISAVGIHNGRFEPENLLITISCLGLLISNLSYIFSIYYLFAKNYKTRVDYFFFLALMSASILDFEPRSGYGLWFTGLILNATASFAEKSFAKL